MKVVFYNNVLSSLRLSVLISSAQGHNLIMLMAFIDSNLVLIGLSKVERPILDHHTKAHNLKSGGFHVKSTQNLINSDVSAKILQFGWISHEIRRISCEIERPLARNCNPMFMPFDV